MTDSWVIKTSKGDVFLDGIERDGNDNFERLDLYERLSL